jgi:hypothetical protein
MCEINMVKLLCTIKTLKNEGQECKTGPVRGQVLVEG